jgi:SAM-dependent methyltransferase
MPAPERHRRLAAALPAPDPLRIADLGCGDGRTLVALRERFGPEAELIGVERREPELDPALAGDPRLSTVVADLNKPLPFPDAALGAVVCHNTLEALVSPDALLAEVARVLVRGGHFLLSHTDQDTVVFNSSDIGLTRRLVHAYADTQEAWMDSADGTIGRKLLAIARRSSFELVEPMAWVEIDTDFTAGEAADATVRGIAGALRRDAHHELASRMEAWVEDQRVRAARGEFLFSVNDYAVLLRRPPGDPQ